MMTVMRRGSADQAQIKAGDQVAAGAAIMQVVDLTSMVVNASVNQVDAEQIRIGAKAHVHFDAYPDLELPAEVVGLGAMPKASSFRAEYVKEVAVSLRLLKLDPRVIPDLSVSADILLDTEPQALVVPRESIFSGGEGKPYVFLQQPTGWVQRDIELSNSNFVAAAVRSGLRAGDVVATERPRLEGAGKK
jgi:HlyD family secretion protein